MAFKIRRKAKVTNQPVLIPTDPVPMVKLRYNQCRWPIDTPDGMLFCSAETPDGKSYCQHHHYLAVQHRKLKPIVIKK